MAACSAQFLPGGAIPLDGRSKIRNALDRGDQLLEELKALSLQSRSSVDADTGKITTRVRKARDKSGSDGVRNDSDKRNC